MSNDKISIIILYIILLLYIVHMKSKCLSKIGNSKNEKHEN